MRLRTSESMAISATNEGRRASFSGDDTREVGNSTRRGSKPNNALIDSAAEESSSSRWGMITGLKKAKISSIKVCPNIGP